MKERVGVAIAWAQAALEWARGWAAEARAEAREEWRRLSRWADTSWKASAAIAAYFAWAAAMSIWGEPGLVEIATGSSEAATVLWTALCSWTAHEALRRWRLRQFQEMMEKPPGVYRIGLTRFDTSRDD